MANMKNKKAAIEMSLNLIIMLIIGMVILGLVIGFVNSLVGKGTQSFNDKLDNVEADQKNEVLKTEGFFVVGPSTISVKKSKNKKIFIKVSNRANKNMVFDAIDTTGKISSRSYISEISLESFNIDAAATGCTLSYVSVPVTIKPQDTQVIVVAIKPSNDCSDGDQLFLNVNFKGNGGTDFDETRTINVKILG